MSSDYEGGRRHGRIEQLKKIFDLSTSISSIKILQNYINEEIKLLEDEED